MDGRLMFRGVSKAYGKTRILEPIDLTVEAGEFLTILGPSGSGKTTLLRLAGGFIEPTNGSISFDGRDITKTPTHLRPFNTVFQDYALFPHMTVAENIGYGLMLRHVPKPRIREAVSQKLDIVGLGGLGSRYPAQLSGGQRQRVALARAIVCEPRIVLLDEPLAALDASMRKQMQLFLKSLQRQIGTTFLFVTHDQEEAMTMSDRVVIMDRGKIEQVGTPRDVYGSPASEFVAGFMGENNLLASVVRDGIAETPIGPLALPACREMGNGKAVGVMIRPEFLRITPEGNVPAKVAEVVYRGADVQVHLVPEGARGAVLLATLGAGQEPPLVGDLVKLLVPLEHARLVALGASR